MRLFVTDRHRMSQPLSQPRRGGCSLLTPEGRTGERKANKRDPLGPRSRPQPGRSSKNRSRGGMPPALPLLSAPFALHVAALGAASGSRPRPLFHAVAFPSFCRRRPVAFTFYVRGRIRILLDKNPHAGFLSPHAPAGAARPRADCPGFPARLRRSSEEEDRSSGNVTRGARFWPGR